MAPAFTNERAIDYGDAQADVFVTMNILIVNNSMGKGYEELGAVLGKDLRSLRSDSSKICVKIYSKDETGSELPMSWRKISRVLTEMERKPGYDWVFWTDSDVIVIDKAFDPSTLLKTDKDLLVSCDAYGVCAGIFAARNCQWVRQYLHTLLLLGPLEPKRYNEFDRKDSWEQNTIKATLRYFPAVRARIGIIPEKLVQNRRSRYSASAWLYHLWMEGRTASEILQKRTLVQQEGWSVETFSKLGQFHGLTWACMPGLAKKLGISLSKLGVYFGHAGRLPPPEQALSGPETDMLIRYANLLDIAAATFQYADETVRWLNRPLKVLGGDTPVVCARTARGFQKTTRALRRIRPEPTMLDVLSGM